MIVVINITIATNATIAGVQKCEAGNTQVTQVLCTSISEQNDASLLFSEWVYWTLAAVAAVLVVVICDSGRS